MYYVNLVLLGIQLLILLKRKFERNTENVKRCQKRKVISSTTSIKLSC